MGTASSFRLSHLSNILASQSIGTGTDNDDVGSGFLIQPVRRGLSVSVPARGLDLVIGFEGLSDIEANAESAAGSDFMKLEDSKFDCSRSASDGH
jgi:hypothetical protein